MKENKSTRPEYNGLRDAFASNVASAIDDGDCEMTLDAAAMRAIPRGLRNALRDGRCELIVQPSGFVIAFDSSTHVVPVAIAGVEHRPSGSAARVRVNLGLRP